MADPFSIVAGTVSVIDVSLRLFNYLKDVIIGAATVEEEVTALLGEIETLISVNESIKRIFTAEAKDSSEPPFTANVADIAHLWRNAGRILQDCGPVVKKLDALTREIIGSSKSSGKFESFKKQMRRKSKVQDFHQLRLQLGNNQGALSLLLTALSLAYTRTSQGNADVSFNQLSKHVQELVLTLKSQIASLRPVLASTENSHLHDSLKSASAVASLHSFNKHFHIPQTVSSIYTGREALLEELKGAFEAPLSPGHSSTQKRFVIFGLGGSGKTQFCCKLAQMNRQNFWGIFWIDASSDENVKHTYSRIAKIGGVEPNERAAKNWLSNLEYPWLLLIDSADDARESLDTYFPEGERGNILVTTRNPAHRVHGTVGPKFWKFEGLKNEEANNLLLKAACEPSPWNNSIKTSASHITAALGFLPLALIHAGRAIMSDFCTLGNHLKFYERSWQRIRKSSSSPGLRRDEDSNMNIYSSYEVIYQRFEASETEAAKDALELLKMFSFLHCEDIQVHYLTAAATNPKHEREEQKKGASVKGSPVIQKPKSWMKTLQELLISIATIVLKQRGQPVLPAVLRDSESFDDLRLRAALAELSQMSLITHQSFEDTYSMHPLVHTWVRQRPQMSTVEQAVWCQAAATTLAQCILLPPLGTGEADEDLRSSLLPHIDHVQKCKREIQERITDNQRTRSRPWPVLAPKFTRGQALEMAKYSVVYSQCGRWNDAERLQLAVKEFVCGLLGMEHPYAIDIMLALAGTYYQQSRGNEAAALQEQVLQACKNSLGPNHPKTLKVMDNLGLTRCYQGHFEKALAIHEEAIKGMTKTLGEDHADTLRAIDHLGVVNWRCLRYDEASRLHAKAAAGLALKLSENHLDTIVATENLAMAYMELGGDRLNWAHEMMLKVVEQRKKKLGKEQPIHSWRCATSLGSRALWVILIKGRSCYGRFIPSQYETWGRITLAPSPD